MQLSQECSFLQEKSIRTAEITKHNKDVAKYLLVSFVGSFTINIFFASLKFFITAKRESNITLLRWNYLSHKHAIPHTASHGNSINMPFPVKRNLRNLIMALQAEAVFFD